MLSYSLKVTDIKIETADCLTISFKQPSLRKLHYKAGQFMSIIFRINGRRYIRSYSFSSAPNIDKSLQITVKRIPNGIASDFLFRILKVGDILEVLAPLGSFSYAETSSSDHVMLWAGGSGITPLMSILKTIIYEHKNTHVTLIYSSRTVSEALFLDTISEFQTTFPERFTLYKFYSREVYGLSRIDKDAIRKILNNITRVNTSHFICGPHELTKLISSSLHECGVSGNAIHVEEFINTVSQEDLDDVTNSLIELVWQGTRRNIYVLKGKSILEAVLDESIEIPFSCQTGSCGLCKAKIVQGRVKRIGMDGRDVNVEDNEYLLCCAYPLTGNIEVHVENN